MKISPNSMQNPRNPQHMKFLSGYALSTIQTQPKQVTKYSHRATLGLDPKSSKGKLQNFKMNTMSIKFSAVNDSKTSTSLQVYCRIIKTCHKIAINVLFKKKPTKLIAQLEHPL